MSKKRCGKLIKQIHTTLEKNANNAFREAELTMAQVDVLMELGSAPGFTLSLKELEKELLLSQPTVAGLVSRLVQKGLVEYCYDANDKRIKLACMTESGKKHRDRIVMLLDGAENRLLGGLTDTEKDIFIALLEKVCGSLK